MNEIEKFLHMGGYAGYVWSSYGIVAIFLLANIIAPLRKKSRLLKRLAFDQQQAED